MSLLGHYSFLVKCLGKTYFCVLESCLGINDCHPNILFEKKVVVL